jgi:hypothetical protein
MTDEADREKQLHEQEMNGGSDQRIHARGKSGELPAVH